MYDILYMTAHLEQAQDTVEPTKGVDPKASWVDGVSDRDVAGNTLGEAKLSEDAVGEGKSMFEKAALGMLVLKHGR